MRPPSTEDTIASVATPPGTGGIGIIRISGPIAISAGCTLFTPSNNISYDKLTERHLYPGLIAGLDEGLFVYMRAPNSYTGEDTVELHCHGGAVVMRKVLEAALQIDGVRTPSPGEFTKRAFLNGKMDLARAEAVAEVIGASTEASLKAAEERLVGKLSGRIRDIKAPLFELLTRLEAELDFPDEEEVERLPDADVVTVLDKAKVGTKALLATYEEGRVLRDGVKVVIVGRPNVGKSSLLNVLLKEARAIVTEHPGTTRDTIEEVVVVKGLPVRLMDTAGLRDTTDPVESIGVEAARKKAGEAELILLVVDLTGGDFTGDLELAGALAGKKVIVVMNKTDIAPPKAFEGAQTSFKGYRAVGVSALKEEGVEGLEEAIFEEAVGHRLIESFGESSGKSSGETSGEAPGGVLVASARHRAALEAALTSVEAALKSVKASAPRELVATDLRRAIDGIGEITGETTTEEILERIFSEFCIGK